jgi:hypothetical protein
MCRAVLAAFVLLFVGRGCVADDHGRSVEDRCLMDDSSLHCDLANKADGTGVSLLQSRRSSASDIQTIDHMHIGESKSDGSMAAALKLHSTMIQTTGRQRGHMMTAGAPETWIVSIGGSGTTSMMQELSQVHPDLHLNSALDFGGIKHRPFGLVGTSHLTNLKRIVYLHGDITHAILSLDRRGWLNIQARKVRSNGNVKDMTLEEYARTEGDDFFQVDMHFHSFRNQCEFDVAFLDITQKADHASELAAFLEVPESEIQLYVRPWQFSMQVEEAMLNQKDYSNFTEEEHAAELKNFEARNLEVANNLEHAGEVPSWQSYYSDVPAWVIEALQEKFAGVTAELQQLGGLYIQKASCGEP